MSKTRIDIIPAQDEKLIVWGNNLILALTPGIGVSDDTITNLKSKITELSDLVDKSTQTQNAAKEISARKRSTRAAINEAFRSEIKRIKARIDYTEAEGVRLGIEASAKYTGMEGATPQLSVVDRTGGLVEISFNKYASDGVNLYCQREGDPDWVLLGFTHRSPFEDKRPLLVTGRAELRRYSAVYVKGKKEVGLFSDEVVAACAP